LRGGSGFDPIFKRKPARARSCAAASHFSRFFVLAFRLPLDYIPPSMFADRPCTTFAVIGLRLLDEGIGRCQTVPALLSTEGFQEEPYPLSLR
jgi:hypothetical protein